MTYTSSTSGYRFFVVGGDPDGTDTGRIYFYNSNSLYLFDYGTSDTKWSNWDMSKWTSNTQLVLTATNSIISSTETGYVGVPDVAAMHTLGFDGSKLFAGVKTL